MLLLAPVLKLEKEAELLTCEYKCGIAMTALACQSVGGVNGQNIRIASRLDTARAAAAAQDGVGGAASCIATKMKHSLIAILLP